MRPMFHDFLGMKPSTDSPVVLLPKGSDSRLTEASPSASASLGASSGGGRGPISTTSDLGSGQSLLILTKTLPFSSHMPKKKTIFFLILRGGLNQLKQKVLSFWYLGVRGSLELYHVSE